MIQVLHPGSCLLPIYAMMYMHVCSMYDVYAYNTYRVYIYGYIFHLVYTHCIYSTYHKVCFTYERYIRERERERERESEREACQVEVKEQKHMALIVEAIEVPVDFYGRGNGFLCSSSPKFTY